VVHTLLSCVGSRDAHGAMNLANEAATEQAAGADGAPSLAPRSARRGSPQHTRKAFGGQTLSEVGQRGCASCTWARDSSTPSALARRSRQTRVPLGG
jgi:hypothetical protein